MDGRVPDGYIAGLGRDFPEPRVAHLYKGDFDEPGMGMCKRAYNRRDGYSIFRNNQGEQGVCAVCLRRAEKSLAPIPWPEEQQTDDNGKTVFR